MTDTGISNFGLHLFGEDNYQEIYDRLTGHLVSAAHDPISRFAVWAPTAQSISVVGDFDRWRARADVMQNLGKPPLAAMYLIGRQA